MWLLLAKVQTMWPHDPARDRDPEKADYLHSHTALTPRAQQLLWPDPKSCCHATSFCCNATSLKFSVALQTYFFQRLVVSRGAECSLAVELLCLMVLQWLRSLPQNVHAPLQSYKELVFSSL